MNNRCTQCLRAIDIAVGINNNNPLMPVKSLEMFLPSWFQYMHVYVFIYEYVYLYIHAQYSMKQFIFLPFIFSVYVLVCASFYSNISYIIIIILLSGRCVYVQMYDACVVYFRIRIYLYMYIIHTHVERFVYVIWSCISTANTIQDLLCIII